MNNLTIVIPFYKETFNEMLPNIQMINSQVGCDWNLVEVLFVNDGVDNKEIENKLSEYPCLFNYKFIYMDENRGPGVCRQTGIDNSSGRYVMFCDADDSFYYVGVIKSFLDIINQDNPPDIICSKWIEEMKLPDGTLTYKNHPHDATWMHGNVYKKGFLEHYDIRFDEHLRIHEDSYMQAIAFARTDNIFYSDLVTYVWRHRQQSIVRREGALYSYSGTATFYESVGKAYDEIFKFKPDILFSMVPQLLFYGYFQFMDYGWNVDPGVKYKDEAVESYKKVIGKYINFYLENKNVNINKIYTDEFNRVENRGAPLYTVTEWLISLGLVKIDKEEKDNEVAEDV